jgi:hypothetical protein
VKLFNTQPKVDENDAFKQVFQKEKKIVDKF